MLALAACEPTGNLRCDAHADILDEIESHGWTVDCAPGFENEGTVDGVTWFPITGWSDAATSTVWVWPKAVAKGTEFDVRRGTAVGEWHVTDDQMRHLLWHELAHVTGITDEDDAEAYAWCREPFNFDRGPSPLSCEELGA
jgi:hypothetical protein